MNDKIEVRRGENLPPNGIERQWQHRPGGSPCPPPTPPPVRQKLPDLVDITTIAARLGVEVRHVRRLVAERRIPYIKWGHLLRFDPADIDTWINDCRHQPRPDTAAS